MAAAPRDSISAERSASPAYIVSPVPSTAARASRVRPSALRARCEGRGLGTSRGQAGGEQVRLGERGSGLEEAAGVLRQDVRTGRHGRQRSRREPAASGVSALSVGAPGLSPVPGVPTAARRARTRPFVVRGREHNLKMSPVELPGTRVIVFTGLSGSGKSSLAFDTIFAEGQRRYVESLSAYARQFLGQMDKPDVDFIEGLSPAVSIDQKSTNRNPARRWGRSPRSHDYLRLLFARAGRPHCPTCGEPITRQSPQQIVDRLLRAARGDPLPGPRPVVRARKGEYVDDLFAECRPRASPGPGRRRGHRADRGPQAGEAGQAHHRGGHRPARRQGRRQRGQAPAHRLGETALTLAGGTVVVDFVDLAAGDPDRERRFSERMACPNDHALTMDEVEPRSFSFNSPFGACPVLPRPRHRAGGRPGPHRPDEDLSLSQGRSRPGRRGRDGTTSAGHRWPRSRPEVLRRRPWRSLPQQAKEALLHGRTTRSTSPTATGSAGTGPSTTGFEGAVPSSSGSMPGPSRTGAGAL